MCNFRKPDFSVKNIIFVYLFALNRWKMLFLCRTWPSIMSWIPQFWENWCFMFSETILCVKYETISSTYKKIKNHKKMKSLFPGLENQTLAVYPCELDLGLWTFGSEDKMDVTHPFWASSLPDTLPIGYINEFADLQTISTETGIFWLTFVWEWCQNFPISLTIFWTRLSRKS